MMIRRIHRQFLHNVKAVPGEFQHDLVAADMDKNKIGEMVRNVHIVR